MSATWRDRRDLSFMPFAGRVLPTRLFTQLVTRSDAYSEEAARALSGMGAAQWPIENNAQFATRFRAQLALAYRDNCALLRNPHCSAPLPPLAPSALAAKGQPHLILSLHWGSAIFALRALAGELGPTHFVSASLNKEEFKQFPLRLAFAQRMAAMIEEICQAPQIYTDGGAGVAIEQALQSGRNVAVLVDVPPHQVGRTAAVKILDRTWKLPSGLAPIAHRTGAQVLTMLCAPEKYGGQHFLELNALGVMRDQGALMPHIGTLIERAISLAPETWAMWAHLPDFLQHHAD